MGHTQNYGSVFIKQIFREAIYLDPFIILVHTSSLLYFPIVFLSFTFGFDFSSFFSPLILFINTLFKGSMCYFVHTIKVEHIFDIVILT